MKRISKIRIKMTCLCDIIFDTESSLIYGYQVSNKTYITIVGKCYKIDTLIWDEWLYCSQCKAYIGSHVNFRYLIDISLSIQSFVVNDVKLKILAYYHLIM